MFVLVSVAGRRNVAVGESATTTTGMLAADTQHLRRLFSHGGQALLGSVYRGEVLVSLCFVLVTVNHQPMNCLCYRFEVEPSPDNPQHEQYVTSLVNALFQEIENKAAVGHDSEYFLIKMKLAEAAKVLRQRYRYGDFVYLVCNLLNKQNIGNSDPLINVFLYYTYINF